MYKIPFNRPTRVGAELENMAEAFDQGHTSAGGPFSTRVSELLRLELGVEDVLLTTSCTDALEMSALLLDIKPGDAVIVPSFTFVSTALAYARQGAEIRFCDIEPERLGLDPDGLADLMDESVRAVVPVHYAGVPCRITEVLDVVGSYENCVVVEDNAHGLFGEHDGKALGTYGTFATLSFHETKNFTCGEGGALLVNDPAYVDRAHTLLDKGTNRRQFMLGHVDKYSWSDTGSSFGMSDLLAGFLAAQLEEREQVLSSREQVALWYEQALKPYVDRYDFALPFVPKDCKPAFHMYYVLLQDRSTRDAILADMNAGGIQSTFHYIPLDSSDGGKLFGGRGVDTCPTTADISGRLLRLPYFTSMTEAEVDETVHSFIRAIQSSS